MLIRRKHSGSDAIHLPISSQLCGSGAAVVEFWNLKFPSEKSLLLLDDAGLRADFWNFWEVRLCDGLFCAAQL